MVCDWLISHRRKLIKNRNVILRYNQFPAKRNLLTYIKELRPKRQITFDKVTNKTNSVRPKTLILGGASGISLAVSINFLRNGAVVRCHADRVSGFRTKVIKPDEGKFDWAMFWRYLKPHLIKFLGAVAVILSPLISYQSSRNFCSHLRYL